MQNNYNNIIFVIIMQTIIGIGICLIVVIYFAIGFMKTYEEGLTDASSSATTTTTANTTKVVANASGSISLTTVAQNIQTNVEALGNTIGIIDNPKRVENYVNIIDSLLDYCDYQVLYTIANVKEDANGNYDLTGIARYKSIKDSLNDSLVFLQSSS